MDMLLMELLDHGLRVRETAFIIAFLAPEVISPGKPVQHDAVRADAFFSRTPGHIQDLLFRLKPLLGLHIAEGPLRQHGGLAGQNAVIFYGAVHSPAHDIVIQLLIRLDIDMGNILLIPEDHGAVGIHKKTVALGRNDKGYRDLTISLLEIQRLSPE